MTLPTGPWGIAVADRAVGAIWAVPEQGFDDWTLDEDLRAVDRLIRGLEIRQISARQADGPAGQHDDGDTPTQLGRRWRVCGWLFLPGFVGLILGALLAAWSCCEGREALRAWALTAAVSGQTAVLLGMLVQLEALFRRIPEHRGASMEFPQRRILSPGTRPTPGSG